MKSHRLALLLSPALLGLCAPLAAETTPARAGVWPQDSSDLAADPAVRFGVLPNGLRYAIQHNETPSTGVSIRMLIGSGSSIERDDEQGLMHFLEHMSFRSSEKIADGDVVRMLQRHGLRFGADTNASTFYDRIIYQFDFTNNDASSIADGMLIFREIASHLKLEPALVEAEKGVVLSEERLRDTAGYRGYKVQQALAGEGSRHVQRHPIGTIDALKSANAERLRRLYQANFRPDNATIFVVGNVDPIAMEKEIRERFSDWKPVGPADVLSPGKVAPSRSVAEFIGEGAPDYLVVNWPGQADHRADNTTTERERLLRELGFTVLNNRLADRAAKAGSPFVVAQIGADDNFAHDSAFTQLQVISPPENWRAALDAAITEQRQLMRDGMSASELARAAKIFKTRLQSQSDSAATRTSAALADALTQATLESNVITSPAQDLAVAGPVIDSATPASVMQALQTAFDGRKPVLFRSAKAGPVGEAVLNEAFTTSLTKPIETRAAEVAFTWPYGDWGKPGAIASRSNDTALGTTTVRFANGTRLVVKQTTFAKDSVRVNVALGGGRGATAPRLAHVLWANDQLIYGGTGKASLAQIQQWAQTTGKVISVSPSEAALTTSLSGTTRPADLDAQLELLAAFARDPGFRPEMEEKVKATAPMYANQLGGNATLAFVRAKALVLTGNDNRFADLPSDADLAATKPGDLKALWVPQLAAPAEITIVGDISPDRAVSAVARTFGAGPALKPQLLPKPRVAVPTGREAPYVFTHNGRKDQAFYAMYWPMPDYFASPKEAAASELLSKVMAQRLIDTVREKLGLSYAPSTDATASKQIGGYGYLGAVIETPQANFATFRKIVIDQMADLAAKPISADELLRAKQQVIQARKQEREKNEYWLPSLALAQRKPALRQVIINSVANAEAVTAADVQALAKMRIVGKVPVTIVVKAKD
ncbi:MAG: insulinase family protein [Novosphingobium sp.]